MKKRVTPTGPADHPSRLMGRRVMWYYTQQKRPWYGADEERTKAMRLEVCTDLLTRPDAFFRDCIFEDEKTFALHTNVNRKNHL